MGGGQENVFGNPNVRTALQRPMMGTQQGMLNPMTKGPLQLNQQGNLANQNPGQGNKGSSPSMQGPSNPTGPNAGGVIGKILSLYPGANDYRQLMGGAMRDMGMGKPQNNLYSTLLPYRGSGSKGASPNMSTDYGNMSPDIGSSTY